MQLDIQTRHFTLGDEQREKIAAGFEKLERFSPRPVVEIKLTITHESGQFGADAVLYLKNTDFRARDDAMEPELAVGEVVESLRKQLTKFKGKVSARQQGTEGGLGKALGPEVITTGNVTPLAAEGFELRDLAVDDALQAFADSDQPFLVFRNIETTHVGVVYRGSDGQLAWMESTNG